MSRGCLLALILMAHSSSSVAFAQQFQMQMKSVRYNPAALNTQQPGGPQYSYLMGQNEVTVSQYVSFLNNAESNQGNARGANLVFRSNGNVGLPDEIVGNGYVFRMDFNNGEIFSNYGISYDISSLAGFRYSFNPAFSAHPIVGVSWFGAVKFCNWLTLDQGLDLAERAYNEGPEQSDWYPVTIGNEVNGSQSQTWASRDLTDAERQSLVENFRGFRLPMDENGGLADAYNEWYKAAAWDGNALLNRAYGFGRESLTSVDANYLSSGDPWETGTTPVGFYDGVNPGTAVDENYYGISDLSGNVREWMQDQDIDGRRTERGGTYRDGNPQLLLRTDEPSNDLPKNGGPAVGFRVVVLSGIVRTDVDKDGDVDGVDFSEFASCYNGAGKPPKTLGCDYRIFFDHDFDGDIDGVDFVAFASCYNGAGNPPKCQDASVLHLVSDAAELSEALSSAQYGDAIQVIVPRIDMPGDYAVPPGVTLTSDGTRENRVVTGNIAYLIGQEPRCTNVTIRHLTIGGYVRLTDPVNALLEDCYLDGDVDDTGVRPDIGAFRMHTWDRPITNATVRRCEPRNFQGDGFSLAHNPTPGGSQEDASGGTLTIENCYLDENSNMGLDVNDQPLTTHAGGKLIVKGGSYGPTNGIGLVASGDPISPIELYDATFIGGFVDAFVIERCTITDGSARLYNWDGVGHMIDSFFENASAIEVRGGPIDVKRCFLRFKDWDSPTPATVTGFNLKANADLAIESSILIGNRRSSSGASRAIVGGGFSDSSRSISVTHCLFHNWGWVYSVDDTQFWACSLLNNVHLDNVNLVTALSSSITTGQANYYDQGGATLLIPGGVEFPDGDGADAYDMFDYANDDFHPLGSVNFIQNLGAPHAMPIYDLDGNLFDPLSPDLGPYRVPE